MDINTYALKMELEIDNSALQDTFTYLDSAISRMDDNLSEGVLNAFSDINSNAIAFTTNLDDAVSITIDLSDRFSGLNLFIEDARESITGMSRVFDDLFQSIDQGSSDADGQIDNITASSGAINNTFTNLVTSVQQFDDLLESSSEKFITITENAEKFNIQFKESSDILRTLSEEPLTDIEKSFESLAESNNLLEDIQKRLSASNFLSKFNTQFTLISQTAKKVVEGVRDISQIAIVNLSGVTSGIKQVENAKAKILQNLNVSGMQLTEEQLQWIKMAGSVENVEGAIKKKNKEHIKEIRHIADEINAMAKLNKSFENLNEQVDENENAIGDLKKNYEQIISYFKSWETGMEKFIEVENRAHGSILDMQDTSARVAGNYGLMRDRVVEVMEALVDVKVPATDMERLAGTIGQTSKATGLSARSLADFSRNIRYAEESSMSFEEAMHMATEAQRQFGLTAEDTGKVLNAQLSIGEQIAFFGDEAPEKFAAADFALRGFGKAAALSAADMDHLSSKLYLTGADAEVFYQKLGGSGSMDPAQRAELMQKRLIEIGNKLQDVNGDVKALSSSEQEQLRVIAQTLELPVSAIGNVAKAERELAKTGGTLFKDVNKAAQELKEGKRVSEAYAQATAMVSEQLLLLRDKITNIILPFVTFAMRGLVPVIYLLNLIITPISWLIGQISKLINWVRDLHWIFQLAFMPFEMYAGFLLVFGGVIPLVVGMIGLLTGSVARLSALFQNFPVYVQNASNALMSVVQFGGRLFVQILTDLGLGLQRLGQAVQPVMLPLLALGAAFMMTGIGARMFAESVKIIHGLGDGATAALIKMGVAMAALGLVIVGLGYLATGAAVGLVALGAAFLMIGAGIYLATSGFAMLLDAIGRFAADAEKFADSTYKIAEGLVVLSVAALVAAPGLIVLGLASAIAAVPLMLGSYGLSMFADAVKKLSDAKFAEIGTEMVAFASNLNESGINILKGSAALMIGSLALLAAAPILTIGVGALMVPVAMMVPLGALLVTANWWMSGASEEFAEIGNRLKTGAIAILVASTTLSTAASGMSSAVADIRAVAPNMTRAATEIETSQQRLVTSFESLAGADYSSIISAMSLSSDFVKEMSVEFVTLADDLRSSLDVVIDSIDKSNEFSNIVRNIAGSITQLDIALSSKITDKAQLIVSGIQSLVNSADGFEQIPEKYAATINKLNSLDVNADSFLSKLSVLSESIEKYVDNITESISHIDSIQLSPVISEQTEVIRNEITAQQEIKPPELKPSTTANNNPNEELLAEMKQMNKNMSMLLELLIESKRSVTSTKRVSGRPIDDSLISKMNI